MFGMTFVRSGRWARVPLFVVPAAAALFALIMGWDRVWPRFFEPDPFAGRREYLQAAVNMIRARPFTGFGLGAYEIASNAFAVKNSPFYPDHFHPNHVHNDWLELAADGGIPFAAGVLALFVARIRAMFSRTWALGIFAVMLHALVDYPFPRAAVSGWMFALLGAVYAESDEANLQSTT
jgi:O-antigen ligase